MFVFIFLVTEPIDVSAFQGRFINILFILTDSGKISNIIHFLTVYFFKLRNIQGESKKVGLVF